MARAFEASGTRGCARRSRSRTERRAAGADRHDEKRGRERCRIERHYTQSGASPYDLIAFATTKSEIRNPDGSVVFSLDNIEVPAAWSQVAADVLAQKYFRKAGVPARLKRVEENGVPSFLWRSVAGRGGARAASQGRALRL